MSCAFGLLTALSAYDKTWDDSAITLGYARTLAETGDIRFGRFGETVEGFSTMLWMLVCTGLARVVREPASLLLAAQATCAGLYILNAALTYALARRVLQTAWAPLALTWAYCGLAAAASGMVDAMENHLFLTLHLALGLVLPRVGGTSPRSRRGELALLPVLCFALMLCRPEGGLTVLAALSALLLGRDGAFDRRDRAAVRLIAVAGLLMAAFVFWRFVHFGSWTPNSVAAKLWPPYFEPMLTRLEGGMRANGRFAEAALLWLLPAAVSGPSGLRALGRAFLERMHRHRFIYLAIGFFFIYHLAAGHPRGTLNRIWLALIPLAMIAAVDAIGSIPRSGVLVRALACAAVFLWVQQREFLSCANQAITVERVRSLLEPAVRLGLALGATPMRLAAPDMGAPLLYWGQEVKLHDLSLLNNRRTARDGWKVAAADLFEEGGPDIIETHSPWTALNGLEADPHLARYRTVSVDGRFYLMRRDLIDRLLTAPPRGVVVRSADELGREQRARMRSHIWTDFAAGNQSPAPWRLDVTLIPARR